MYGLPDETWTEWKRKRRNTLIGLVIVGTAVGIDTSVVFSTLYLYLKDTVKTEQPQMWYGLIVAFYFLSSTIVGAICGRWLDRTRKVRLYVNMSLLVQIVGFVLYVIPLHPVILLVGRMICGFAEPFTSVVAGEIFRIFEKKESTKATLWLSMIYCFGFIIGPTLNFLFEKIPQFWIGPIIINHLNFIGIFMIGLMIVVCVVANCLVHNCSLMFDLKEYLVNTGNYEEKDEAEKSKSTTNTADEKTMQNEEPSNAYFHYHVDGESPKGDNQMVIPPTHVIPINVVLRMLLSNKDTLLILITTFIFVYTIYTESAMLPLLITITLKWDFTHLCVAYAVFGVCDFILIIILGRLCDTNKAIYYTSIASIFSQIVGLSCLISFKLLARNFERDVILMVLWILANAMGWCFDDSMVRVLLASMVPSSVQSFSETLRAGVARMAFIFGSFTVAVVLPWAEWWSVVLVVAIALNLVAFLIRWRQLMDPKEILFAEYMPLIGKESP